MENQKMYMHIESGTIDTASGWIYDNEETGKLCDPVEEGDPALVEVVQDDNGEWVEPDEEETEMGMETKKTYMNPKTGTVGGAECWIYESEDGEQLDGVARGEVVEVVKNSYGEWTEKRGHYEN